MQADLAKRHSPEILSKLDVSLARAAEKIEIPTEISIRHPGVNTIGLQWLLEAFRAYEGDVENPIALVHIKLGVVTSNYNSFGPFLQY